MFKYICLLFIFYLCNVKGQTLNANDKSNIGILLAKLGLVSEFNSDNYCNSTSNIPSNTIRCRVSGSENFIDQLSLNVTGSYLLESSDINVFTKLTIAKFCNLKFSDTFLHNQYPSLNSITFYNPIGLNDSLFQSKISNGLATLTFVDVKTPISLTLSLSNLQTNSLNSFTFTTIKDDPLNDIRLINDLPNGISTEIPNFYINLKDIPNMNNTKGNSFYMNTYTEPVGGLSNLNTFVNISNISFKIRNSTSPTNFAQFSSTPTVNIIESIHFSGSLLKPTSTINLSNLNIMKQLSIESISDNFNIDGEIPLILPPGMNSLTILNGAFNGDKTKQFLINNSKIKTLIFSNNSISSNFTEWTSQYNSLDIRYNQLYGSINPSWCTSILYVSYNQLSGDLPSCFTCHMQSSSLKNNFIGGINSFTNISPPPICTTLIPNLKYDSNSNLVILYGQDLGFDANQIKSSPISISFNPDDFTPSKLFTGSNSSLLPEYVDLTFTTANKTYRVSTVQKAPSVLSITPSSPLNTITFDGSFFNYNSSSFNITVGYHKCIVTSATFYQVICTLQLVTSYDPNAVVSISINVDDYSTNQLVVLTSNVYAYLNKTSSVLSCTTDCSSQGKVCDTINGVCITECPNHCSGPSHGTCNTNTGVCGCTSKFQGAACLIPVITCPNDCSNAGTCNPLNGECSCNPNRLFLNCSGINCTNTCEHSSTCDTSIGVCKCVPNYQGSNCTIPSHYISSVIPCSISGGEVSIIGWFGNDDDFTHSLSYYTVKIGALDCNVTSINTTTIKCNLGAGSGTKNIAVINSLYPNIVFNGNGLFNYINPVKTCLNSCTSSANGVCNIATGNCICNQGYTGLDCSSIKSNTSPSTNSSIDTSSGNTTLSNQYTNYEISIIQLNEISYDGSIVITYPLYKDWTYIQENTDLNTFKFTQTLKNSNCTIAYTVEEIKSDEKSFTFGTTSFTLEKGSIKLSVLIKDYKYQSTLNTLQLLFYSTSGDDSETDCNEQESSTDTSNVDNQQVSSYIQITKNSKKLIGRFINQVIADSRPTFMSSTIIKNNNDDGDDSSITLGLNLPHCNECLIDPDFSVLVTDDFQDSCGKSTRNKWVVPVAVVIPVVTIAIIIVVVSILYRKNRIGIKVFKTKLKSLK
ncbi:hypothetical protein ACTA71_009101 [Dictyostelium dimigraforme]